MIKAVIFDMDGLLIDSEPLWQRINKKVYKELGIDVTDAHRQRMVGRTPLENAQYLHSLYPWEKPSPEEVVGRVIKEMIVAVKSDIKLMPGVHQALQVCKQANLPVAIASSSPEALIEAVVDTLEIREHFGHIYSAQFEPYGKPHPGVFLRVAELFQISPPSCLVFEDSPAGVLAAKAANMLCIAVPGATIQNHTFIQTADRVIESLEDFDETMLQEAGQN